jgi:hypothetical protein
MQEDGAVGWDPAYIDRQPSVLTNLFVLYLFFVTIVSLVRWIRLLRQLWWLKRHSQVHNSEDAALQLTSVWNADSAIIQASKRLVVATCLLSGAVAARQVASAMRVLAYQTSISLGALRGDFTDALAKLAIGLWVSVAVYVAFAFCEGVLARQRNRLGRPIPE